MLAQRVAALVALILMGPILIALAMAIRVTSPGPALYRSMRAAPRGTFTILKFRTMVHGTTGIPVTAAGDPRITRIGRFLRRTKLDELPQLINVARGEMAFVGPRPEDPRYVDMANPVHSVVFGVLPGVTGPAALTFRHEEAILAGEALRVARRSGRIRPTDVDIESAYREVLLPEKLALEAAYLRTRTIRSDVRILVRTIAEVLRHTDSA
jgi:lipopolysaccharide/colanic/teichoic acid biosynthesis glycosyltransferase